MMPSNYLLLGALPSGARLVEATSRIISANWSIQVQVSTQPRVAFISLSVRGFPLLLASGLSCGRLLLLTQEPQVDPAVEKP